MNEHYDDAWVLPDEHEVESTDRFAERGISWDTDWDTADYEVESTDHSVDRGISSGTDWDTDDLGNDIEEAFKPASNVSTLQTSRPANDKEYSYSPVDTDQRCIRLLKPRRPCPGSGRIQCSLSTHILGEAPCYTALSYTWSRPDASCCISVDGKRAQVGKNLLRFFQMAQDFKHYRATLFWIDAI
ncbi:hypothetical protein CLAFUW4_14316 [Fulvia fulva]|uniref:Heterokaryon incompatibility domain-containing protein n=1 Tax=Passalora fulva TaxID=5499 RepID=A0A9Q8PM71_PASFU|nr:uncharacterized protein CLAFUR5_14149 [Fulvia fulva]KAK4609459.1 hypothetical protein CLAFUR4_14316 [Fulvia fulva]KAK4609706.1 hypothetical protein CLAFUR0_14320 [Fulvia fulva]UJO25184.1 hypothetical protein CLAFUR5_14149 [Fulvia fulva]WPV22518.1 hypothetical protein CLAFUW4_14316 [Fulvia fulva]WPV37837.1 hypothetical protein CLAFUW7_14324 [Fulvia fulva]